MWERISGYTSANEGENQLLYVGAPQLKKKKTAVKGDRDLLSHLVILHCCKRHETVMIAAENI
jgi:hypothetical protein